MAWSEEEDIEKAVSLKLKEYFKRDEGNRKKIKKDILNDIDNLHENYLYFLNIPLCFEKQIKRREAKEKSMKVSSLGFTKDEYAIVKNSIFTALTASPAFKKNLDQMSIKSPDVASLKKIYLECLEIEGYKEYLKGEKSEETDIQIFKKIFKTLFKSKTLETDFEEKDILWKENVSILKGLCASLVKEKVESIEKQDLFTSIINDDDRQFWLDLYDQTTIEDKSVSNIITEKIKNWDADRVTTIDKILIKMGIQEMMHHPSIPVKVTMNEYIELSKKYSTPKSKQFVNGILDVISKELQKSGEIKKSARGLIDNK